MFEDLIPSAPAQAPAPPPGMFDDLIPGSEVPSGYTAAVTDIPREVAQSTKEAAQATAEHWANAGWKPEDSNAAWYDIRPELRRFVETPKVVASAIGTALAPIQGIGRSLLGHPIQEADRLLRAGAVALYGEDKVRAAEQAAGATPGGMTWDEARRIADTASSLSGPRGGLGAARLPVQPAAPLPPPPKRSAPPPSEPVAAPRESGASTPAPPESTTGLSGGSPEATSSEPVEAVTAPPADAGSELPPLHEGARITGEGPHGPIVDGYQGRWADAVDWLQHAQTGDARGVLSHPDVPDPIDVVWGNELGGLQHILQDHPEVAADLPQRFEGMRAVSATANRIVLEGGDARAVVRRGYDGEKKTWLLTAYETRREGGRTESPSDLPGPTRSSGPPGSDNLGSPAADNKFEIAPAPAPRSQQQIADNRSAIADAVEGVGVPPERIDPADIEGVARKVTRRDLLTFKVFRRAVIGDALERGFATPQEVDQIYGKGSADEYQGRSTPANGDAAPAPRRGGGSMGSPSDLLGPTRSSSPPGGDNVGSPLPDNKFEIPSAPEPPSQQQIAENRSAIADAVRGVGVPPERIDPADIEWLARSVTRRDLLTFGAFKRAVIRDAIERGFATPQEVDQTYGKGSADEYRGTSAPANGDVAAAQVAQRGRPGSDAPEGQQLPGPGEDGGEARGSPTAEPDDAQPTQPEAGPVAPGRGAEPGRPGEPQPGAPASGNVPHHPAGPEETARPDGVTPAPAPAHREVASAGRNIVRARSPSLQGTEIDVVGTLFKDVGLKPGRFYANYDALSRKHPEYLPSPEAARSHVEHVLSDPEVAIPQRSGNLDLIARSKEGNRLIGFRAELKNNRYDIRTAYIVTEGQLARMKEGAAHAGATVLELNSRGH